MQYKIEYKPKAVKFLNSVSEDDKERIQKRISELAVNPRNESVIKLSGIKPNQYRARQGNYRILFTICDEKLIVEVIDIKNRQDAYKK
jgi:mRNA interferase RelE/StbE